MIIQAVRRLIVPAPAMPQRRAFLRGLLAAGGTAAVAPLLLPAELANLDDVLMDLHGRRTVDMGASSLTIDGQAYDYMAALNDDYMAALNDRCPDIMAVGVTCWMIKAYGVGGARR